MTKRLILIILLFSTPSYAQVFSLEELSDNADKYVAASDIQEAMRKFTKKDFIDCTKQKNIVGTEYSTYFSAIPIDLHIKHKSSFLVFPSKYCFAFFGAHAIAYWIIIKEQPNHYRLLYEGRSDGLEILNTYTKGMKDIQSVYGNTYIILKFTGRNYKRAGDGEFQWKN